MCSALFPRPIKLELEKVLCPTVMAGKKNYSAGKWTDPGHDDSAACAMEGKIIVAGMRPIRRDTCDWVRKAILTALHSILKERDLPKALLSIRQAVSDLMGGNVSWSFRHLDRSDDQGETWPSQRVWPKGPPVSTENGLTWTSSFRLKTRRNKITSWTLSLNKRISLSWSDGSHRFT